MISVKTHSCIEPFCTELLFPVTELFINFRHILQIVDMSNDCQLVRKKID